MKTNSGWILDLIRYYIHKIKTTVRDKDILYNIYITIKILINIVTGHILFSLLCTFINLGK